MRKHWKRNTAAGCVAALAVLGLVLSPKLGWTHCDTLDGPVVAAARLALEKGDVTPALKWVRPERETDIRHAFQRTLEVRSLSPEARELADRFFFETLVRLHREGEGAPFTGLKPAGSVIEPAVLAADAALESGSVDSLVDLVLADVEEGLRQRFARARNLKRHVDDSVEAGREFVAAYVEFVHYAERLHLDATSPAAHSAAGAEHGHGDHQ